ncbi:MAG: cysteine-S-conjugate beta-lyase [Methanobacterium sp.]|uniref:MalY/PatB family protein n=1 Tax=Methanobacterium sp. TaxID=2164 RepID=UPI0003C98F21|nr:MalY/PatB family protein [Methanobacterium sp.]MDI3549788.1 cysteine-S-conjugate beta-lyase [Methanobacterium sp.]MDI6645013.1 MalY/PatB family protein [Methanobacteriaceae archaeon]MDI6882630.1 MalY/PatB family protein [Methanothermobacter sp.]CDG65256.1 cystathionine beta-lyase [Methanobacterium sp. MB1]
MLRKRFKRGYKLKYDFDQVINRENTDSLKWDLQKRIFGKDDLIPMWVADMDLPVAQPIIDSIKKRAEHPFYGYTYAGSSVQDSVVERMMKKFQWEINPEWVVFTPGVVPALHVAVRSLTHPGDEIIIQEPAYHPFFPVIKNSGCHIASNPLKLINGRYEMDYNGLKDKFRPQAGRLPDHGRVKAIIFCNPHNPVGRLWKKDEIIKMGEIIIENEGIVISDEIHCEIVFKGRKHTPFASISEEFQENSIVCMSPSKTFNLAGLEVSSIIIPNKKLRKEFLNTMAGIVPGPNLFGYTALEAAYRDGDEWLEQVLEYLEGNLEFLTSYFKKRIQGIDVIETEGTYLAWLDCRELGMDDQRLQSFFRNKAKVAVEDGYIFGKSGSGFVRMNFALPRSILEDGLRRIEDAVVKLQKG